MCCPLIAYQRDCPARCAWVEDVLRNCRREHRPATRGEMIADTVLHPEKVDKPHSNEYT